MEMSEAPACPGDGLRMVFTVAGWRCPMCGLATLRTPDLDRARARAAHPSSRGS